MKISYMAIPGLYNDPPSVEEIIYGVCRHHRIYPALLKKKSRKQFIVKPRQEVHYLIKKHHPEISYYAIGKMVGDKGHVTVLYSVRTISDLMETDKVFRKEMQEIERNLTEVEVIKDKQTA